MNSCTELSARWSIKLISKAKIKSGVSSNPCWKFYNHLSTHQIIQDSCNWNSFLGTPQNTLTPLKRTNDTKKLHFSRIPPVLQFKIYWIPKKKDSESLIFHPNYNLITKPMWFRETNCNWNSFPGTPQNTPTPLNKNIHQNLTIQFPTNPLMIIMKKIKK